LAALQITHATDSLWYSGSNMLAQYGKIIRIVKLKFPHSFSKIQLALGRSWRKAPASRRLVF
jgi:hypothetical protein